MIDFDATVLAAAQAAFGELVLYGPAGGQQLYVSGIFDEHFVAVKLQDGFEVSEVRPVIDMRLSALAALPAQGDNLVIRGRAYVVAEPAEPDSFGDVRLFLRLADDAEFVLLPGPPVPAS